MNYINKLFFILLMMIVNMGFSQMIDPPCVQILSHIKKGKWDIAKKCLDDTFKNRENRIDSKAQYWYGVATLNQINDSLTSESTKDSLLMLTIDCFCKSLYYDSDKKDTIQEIKDIDSTVVFEILSKRYTNIGVGLLTELKEFYLENLLLLYKSSSLPLPKKYKYELIFEKISGKNR